MGKKVKEFNTQEEINHIVDEIREYFAENGGPNTKAVIGISGGKDSTVAAMLLVKALGKERVHGVLMPNDYQADITDAYDVVTTLGVTYETVNIGPIYRMCETALGYETLNDRVTTNLPSRLRMCMLYAVAASVEGGGRVINTGNASEAYVGYTTKYGDLAGDYAVLLEYHVREVVVMGLELAKEMNIPDSLITKAPSDGMTGKTDEDSMGFTYAELDAYLIDGIVPSAEVLHNIKERHRRNRHKEAINLPRPSRHGRGDWYF